MNELRRLIVCLVFAGIAGMAFAHPGGHGDGPPITKEDANAFGDRVVSALVENKKLAPTWQGKRAKEVSSRLTQVGTVWLISYENPDEVDPAKRTLYIYFDEFGNYIGGNHSGKL